jgi:hypothetical protein
MAEDLNEILKHLGAASGTASGNILLDFDGDLRDLAAYEARGGYAMLKRAVETMSGEDIVAAISESGLRGRGGAGFPTGRKASFLAPASPSRARPRTARSSCATRTRCSRAS